MNITADDPNARRYARWWKAARKELNDTTENADGHYTSFKRALTLWDDINLCFKDAEAGNERAQRYMAEFLKQRMLG